jgi:hypothetical protein
MRLMPIGLTLSADPLGQMATWGDEYMRRRKTLRKSK